MKVNFKRVLGSAQLCLKKHSPEILAVVGAAGVVTSTVLACKATIKAKEIVDANKEELEVIHEAREVASEEVYTKRDYAQDLTAHYTKVGLQVAKVYAPAVILGGLSLGSMFASNNILRKRNASLAAAYATLDSIFRTYRKNVVDTYGEEVDHNMRYSIHTEKVTEEVVDENGKVKKVKVEKQMIDPNQPSEFARFFDQDNVHFAYDHESGYPQNDYNLMFLKNQQAYCNDLLKSRGYLFLNEVYSRLGFPMTVAGQSAGWIYKPEDKDTKRDNFVDFGIWKHSRANQRFINGIEDVILLDFNIDGNILESPDLKLWKM